MSDPLASIGTVDPPASLVRELKRRDEQMRLAMEAGRLGTWEWNIKTGEVYWSPSLQRIHGLEPGTFAGTFEAYQQDIHPDDRELVFATVQNTLVHRKPHRFEYRIILPSGETRWVEARGQLFTDDADAPDRLVGICMDVTERRRADDALREIQARLVTRTRISALAAEIGLIVTRAESLDAMLQSCAQAVVSHLDAAFARVWTLDTSGQTLELRASAGLYTHLNGAHGRVPVGQFKIGRIARDRRPHLSNQVVGDPEVGDQDWASREGMVAFAGYPLLVGRELVGVLAMFARHALSDTDFEGLETAARSVSLSIARLRDVEALRASEERYRARAEELTALTGALERSNRELDAFAYAASHDLRAPLRGIANLAQWIEEDLQGTLSDDAQQMLALMRARMHRMEALIEGILQYSRAGRTPERAVTVSVGDLLAGILEMLGTPADIVTFDTPMPVLVTQRPPLQQVFQNLISNALKHGGDGVRVHVSCADAGAFWKFSVADTGPGIPAEFHDRIWGIFQTLAPRDKVEGAGIGLSLVKKVVETHGGSVSLVSSPGNGATFGFLWPKQPALEGA